mgnify:CR=1 FL=1
MIDLNEYRKKKDWPQPVIDQALTPRWNKLRYHPVQYRYFTDSVRFPIAHGGRRSGKTEIAKRRIVRAALAHQPYGMGYYFIAAPTFNQVKRIYWTDIKKLVPRNLMRRNPNESEMIVYLPTSEIHLIGMDRPERIEGSPWDGGLLDEFGNMKKEAFYENVRPALSDRLGSCVLLGVPEGRNHYWDLRNQALSQSTTDQGVSNDKRKYTKEWGIYHWPSWDILPESEINSAKAVLDELTFQQEYGGEFVHFQGMAYYNFRDEFHCAHLDYNPRAPLIFCYDFNVDPGVAAVCQEYPMLDEGENLIIGDSITGVIGEVHIPRGSNTVLVTRKLINMYRKHESWIKVYGDATGGARGTAKILGSDWEIIRDMLHQAFGDRVVMRVGRSNPPERARVNSVNSRLKSGTGVIRLVVDPNKAPHVVRDFEGVRVVEGGSGEIDKKRDPALSHLTDSIGYYIHTEFPISRLEGGMAEVMGI